MASGWTWSDAWFFEAVAWAEPADGGADLSQVVAAADAINHAVLGRDEIEGAIHRLTGAGLLMVLARRLTLTARGHALRRPAMSRGVFDRMTWLELQLRRMPLAQGAPEWAVAEDEWRLACDTYRREFWAAYRRLSGRG